MDSLLEYIFVGAFGKASRDGAIGGQLTACRTLIRSPISRYIKWHTVDSTMLSVPPPSRGVRTLLAARRMFKFIRFALRPSVTGALILTSSGASFVEKGTMVLLARILRKRVVFSPRSGLILDDLKTKAIMRWFARFVLSRCDVIMCQSRSWQDFYQSFSGLPTRSFAVIPNWLDTRPYLELTRPESPSHGNIQIIYVGWIESYKGIFDLVEAVRIFKRALTGCRIHICGKGSQFATMQQKVADARLEDFFQFHGWLDFPQKLDQLRKADIFVLPSHREGLPNALLEAMAAGLPVVATRVGGVPEILADPSVGILLDPHDCHSLGKSLVDLASKAELRASFGKQARKHVKTNYDIDCLWPVVLDALSPTKGLSGNNRCTLA